MHRATLPDSKAATPASPCADAASRVPALPRIVGRWLIALAGLTPLLVVPVADAQPQSDAEKPGAPGAIGVAGAPFVLRAMGHCLEVNEPQLQVDGARVQLGRCDGRPHQTWRNDRGRLVNLANGRCLDVHGPDAGLDGARVQVVNCSAAPNQQWRQERGQLIARVDERCLEALGLESARPLPTAQNWACSGERTQRWRVVSLPAPVASPQPPAPPPPSTVRDVAAGPLFSNADATNKCPSVCAPGRWNGQWVTTVPGRMSVCGCVFEPPATPGPAAAPLPTPPPPTTPANQAMAPDRFDELVRLLNDEAFPSNALRTLQTVARDHRFSVEQVRRLFEILAFGSDRLRALEITLPRLTDPGNAYELIGAFTFEGEKAQARQLIERASVR
jgi:hypothetical protein